MLNRSLNRFVQPTNQTVLLWLRLEQLSLAEQKRLQYCVKNVSYSILRSCLQKCCIKAINIALVFRIPVLQCLQYSCGLVPAAACSCDIALNYLDLTTSIVNSLEGRKIVFCGNLSCVFFIMLIKFVLNPKPCSVKSARDSLIDVIDDHTKHHYKEEGHDDHSGDHALFFPAVYETEQLILLTSAALIVRTAATRQGKVSSKTLH